MAEITCKVVTPEKTSMETQADFVAVTLYDGELGIAPGHTPLIGRLGCGELRIRRGGETERFYIDGGFVQVKGNTVSILTQVALPAEEVSAEQAKADLDTAIRKPCTTAELSAARDRALTQARARLHVARRTRGGGTRHSGH